MHPKLDPVEQKMLDQMVAEEGQVCEDADLAPQSNIKEEAQEELQLVPVSKKVLPLLFEQLKGIKFKFGEAFFQINFTNPGKRRFSAELLNPVEEASVDKIIKSNKG